MRYFCIYVHAIKNPGTPIVWNVAACHLLTYLKWKLQICFCQLRGIEFIAKYKQIKMKLKILEQLKTLIIVLQNKTIVLPFGLLGYFSMFHMIGKLLFWPIIGLSSQIGIKAFLSLALGNFSLRRCPIKLHLKIHLRSVSAATCV